MTSPGNDNLAGTARTEPCPICKAPADAGYMPFCSKRCANVDLHRWLSGRYAIPTAEDDSDGARVEPDEA